MDAPVHVGDVIAGRLHVVREIARGGMGVLFEADDSALGRRVALKVVLGELAKDASIRERLLREARAAARLASPHVAQVLEVGTLPGSGVPYVVMELLEGETVEHVLARSGPLGVDVALEWTRQALEGLAAAHAAGLVHRDLKPSNVFVTRTLAGDVVKVLDFGIVRDSASTASLTQTGESLGTPAYMAPEQFSAARDVGPAADVWAMGVTLYEMLTARLPFEATSIPELLHLVASGVPTPIARFRSDVPDDVLAVVQRCLERDPMRRFRDAREMHDAIAAVLALRAPTLHDPVPRPVTTHRRARARKSRLPIAVAAALATIVVGGAAVIAFVVSRPHPSTPAAAASSPPERPPPAPAPTPTPSTVIEPDRTAPDASASPPKVTVAPRAPKTRCRCERNFQRRIVTLCQRYGPPYACVEGTALLCLESGKGRDCARALADRATPGEVCEGFHRDWRRPGRWTAIGACVDYDVAPGGTCWGRLAWDAPPTSGDVRCD